MITQASRNPPPTVKRPPLSAKHCANAAFGFLTETLVADILYADRFFLKGKTVDEKIKIRDLWLQDYLRAEYRLPKVARTDVMFFRSLVREDYKQLFHSVITAAELSDYVVAEDYKRQLKEINIEASRHLIDVWPLISLVKVGDPLDRVCCFIRLCMYTFILKQLRKVDFKVLVCFADMQPVEHLAAYYFRSIGRITITLQHGLYVDYGNLDTVNVINYLHQPSQHFLAWGDSTARLVRQYHPTTKISICGKPLVFTGNPSTKSHDRNAKWVTVFLDQKVFDSQNERMLNIVLAHCRKFGLKVGVRFHPSLDKKAYLKKYPEIVEQLYFLDSEFVVGHTSSLIYEAIALGCRAFRYQTDVPAIPLPAEYSFQTENELAACTRQAFSEAMAKDYIVSINADSRRMYRRFFRQLSNDLSNVGRLALTS